MTLRTASRIGAALALALGSVMGAAIASAPAQAQAQVTCGDVFHYNLNAPYSIQASNGYVCDYHETSEYVAIYKDGQLVAAGDGSTYYVCNGSAANEYVIEGADTSGAGPFALDCG
jgi:hypothetical protein